MVLKFGLLALAALLLLQLGKYSLLGNAMRVELAVAMVALFFLFTGWSLSRAWRGKTEEQAEAGQAGFPEHSREAAGKLGLSAREYEVLQELERGLSNREIAQKLFISESTVKTHVSSLLSKLGARRRSQAVQRARKSGIL